MWRTIFSERCMCCMHARLNTPLLHAIKYDFQLVEQQHSEFIKKLVGDLKLWPREPQNIFLVKWSITRAAARRLESRRKGLECFYWLSNDIELVSNRYAISCIRSSRRSCNQIRSISERSKRVSSGLCGECVPRQAVGSRASKRHLRTRGIP